MEPVYYRLHDKKVSEEEFIKTAKAPYWVFDRQGRLVKCAEPGYWAAFRHPSDLLAALDDAVGDDALVAIFTGTDLGYVIASDAMPESPRPGETWVAPTKLIGWITVKNLKKIAKGRGKE